MFLKFLVSKQYQRERSSMIINTENIQELLDCKNISTNQIMDITGFNRKNVWNYRAGKTQLMNMQLKTLIKLQDCYNQTYNNIMKYKNFLQVIKKFNSRYGQTQIFLDPYTNELKILIEGIIGDINKNDIEIYNKDMAKKITPEELISALEK